MKIEGSFRQSSRHPDMDENGIHVVAIAQLETSVSQHACAEFAVSNAQVEPNSHVAGITTINSSLVKPYTYNFPTSIHAVPDKYPHVSLGNPPSCRSHSACLTSAAPGAGVGRGDASGARGRNRIFAQQGGNQVKNKSKNDLVTVTAYLK